jgi:hypothetical protein
VGGLAFSKFLSGFLLQWPVQKKYHEKDRTRNGTSGFFVRHRRLTMPHRRISGAKVRSHKIGIGNSRYAKGKQARLQNRRMLSDYFRFGDPAA